ncbi:hypothetical protein EMPS_00235 [Entomortierella parvispora]|uniref:SWIM-type domain-containing protein n=1 Tax=Entomortierella parvispora TaxID=205924 RepID=A0A9P3GZZ3_9FUNG|nr:hypothetical protein EMPS_00235 [Entomortierella parvispora]
MEETYVAPQDCPVTPSVVEDPAFEVCFFSDKSSDSSDNEDEDIQEAAQDVEYPASVSSSEVTENLEIPVEPPNDQEAPVPLWTKVFGGLLPRHPNHNRLIEKRMDKSMVIPWLFEQGRLASTKYLKKEERKSKSTKSSLECSVRYFCQHAGTPKKRRRQGSSATKVKAEDDNSSTDSDCSLKEDPTQDDSPENVLKKRPRQKTSGKVGCKSYVLVKYYKNSEEAVVTYRPYHTGHQTNSIENIRHCRLSKWRREQVERMLDAGHSRRFIYEKLSKAPPEDKSQFDIQCARNRAITKEDIYNIDIRRQRITSQLDQDERISMRLWGTKLREQGFSVFEYDEAPDGAWSSSSSFGGKDILVDNGRMKRDAPRKPARGKNPTPTSDRVAFALIEKMAVGLNLEQGRLAAFIESVAPDKQPIEPPTAKTGPKERFGFGFISPWQRKMLQQFGAGFSIDATHGTTRHDNTQLYTIVVAHSSGKGIPVAFFLTSDMSASALSLWLSHVRCQLMVQEGSNKPYCIVKTIVVDDSYIEKNAINYAFDDVKIQLCLWRVQRAWARALPGKIHPDMTGKNKDEKAQLKRQYDKSREVIFKMLRRMMYTQDPDQASLLQQSLRQALTLDSAYTEDLEYLDTTSFTLEKREQWMRAYRSDVYWADINTNNYVESWHSQLKSKFLRDNKSPRLDTVINVLSGAVVEYFQSIINTATLNLGRQSKNTKEYQDRLISVQRRFRNLTAQQRLQLFRHDTLSNRLWITSFDKSDGSEYEITAIHTTYPPTIRACECPDFKRRLQPCKHIIAATLMFPNIQLPVDNNFHGSMTTIVLPESKDTKDKLLAGIEPGEETAAVVLGGTESIVTGDDEDEERRHLQREAAKWRLKALEQINILSSLVQSKDDKEMEDITSILQQTTLCIGQMVNRAPLHFNAVHKRRQVF